MFEGVFVECKKKGVIQQKLKEMGTNDVAKLETSEVGYAISREIKVGETNLI